MEGTRLTIVRVPTQPDAYEFSIRTPVTPPRWKDFDQVGPHPPPVLASCLTSIYPSFYSCTMSQASTSLLSGVCAPRDIDMPLYEIVSWQLSCPQQCELHRLGCGNSWPVLYQ